MPTTVIVRDNTRRRKKVHLDLVAHCCRKFTTSGTSTLSPKIIYYRIIRKTCSECDESTRKTLFYAVGYNNLNRATRNTCARIAVSNIRKTRAVQERKRTTEKRGSLYRILARAKGGEGSLLNMHEAAWTARALFAPRHVAPLRNRASKR